MLTVLAGPIIPAGESLSGALDLGGAEAVRLTMPAQWHPDAILSFEISTDGGGYNSLCDGRGDEIVVNVEPGAAVLMPEEWGRAIGFLKVRSGSRDNPVPQDDLREFAVAVRTSEGGQMETSGLIHNFGVVAANTNGVTVTFETPYSELPSVTLGDTSTTHSRLTAVTLTSFTISGQGDVNWSAIGR